MLIARNAQVNSPEKKTIGSNPVATPQFHYQTTADMVDLLLSVYELTGLSEEIYFDVNQKITALLSHICNLCDIQWKSAHLQIVMCLEIATKLSDLYSWYSVNAKVEQIV